MTLSIEEAKLKVDRIPVDDRGSLLGLVTLNAPETRNPLDWERMKTIGRVFDELAEDPAVRVVAVTGTGKVFSAGGDMKKYQELQRNKTDFPQFLIDVHDVVARISGYPKPYVALVNGTAVAGGFEMIIFCDLAFAAESARFGDAHLPFGQMGGGGVLTMLPRLVGPSRARELIFSGRLLTAREALEWGIVSKVVPDGELVEAAKTFAADVAKKSPLGIANAKHVLNSAYWEGTNIHAGMRLERAVTAYYCLTSDDAREGLNAFAEKRQPQYRGT